jgi:hypothetical protein
MPLDTTTTKLRTNQQPASRRSYTPYTHTQQLLGDAAGALQRWGLVPAAAPTQQRPPGCMLLHAVMPAGS